MPRFLNTTRVLDPTDSVGSNTGSLQTLGGAWVAKQLRVDGLVYLSNTQATTTPLNGSLTTPGGVGCGSLSVGAVPNLPSQAAKTIFAAPNGAAGVPGFRLLTATDYPVFLASGATHAPGAVPDPGATAGTLKFLREDTTWVEAVNLTTNQSLGGLKTFNQGLALPGITTPTAPTSDLILYGKGTFGKLLPSWIGPSGQPRCAQSLMGSSGIGWWAPPGNSTTAPGVAGLPALTWNPSGNVTARNVSTTNMFTRMKRLGIITQNPAGSICGTQIALAQSTIGGGTGLGGFFMVVRFGFTDTAAAARAFVGMTASVAVPTNVEPSTLVNCIGVGKRAADTSLVICYGGSAAQTPIALGANFPASTSSTDVYELILYAPL